MTRSRRLILALAAVFVGAVGPVHAEPPKLTGAQKLELGHAIVDRNCSMCHAVETTGVSANPEAPPFRLLNRKISVDDLSEALAEGIMTGHPAMPEFRFEPREVEAIVLYLKSIQTRVRV